MIILKIMILNVSNKNNKNFSLSTSSKVVSKIISSFNLGRVVICSRSLYTKNALHFALTCPSKVSGLVLFSPMTYAIPDFVISVVRSRLDEQETKSLLKAEIKHFQSNNPLFNNVDTNQSLNLDQTENWFNHLKEMIDAEEKRKDFYEKERVKMVLQKSSTLILREENEKEDDRKFLCKNCKVIKTLFNGDKNGENRLKDLSEVLCRFLVNL